MRVKSVISKGAGNLDGTSHSDFKSDVEFEFEVYCFWLGVWVADQNIYITLTSSILFMILILPWITFDIWYQHVRYPYPQCLISINISLSDVIGWHSCSHSETQPYRPETSRMSLSLSGGVETINTVQSAKPGSLILQWQHVKVTHYVHMVFAYTHNSVHQRTQSKLGYQRPCKRWLD